ncbi:MAG: acyl-protein synthetase [Butyrivibrio sp.]|nr:hypothetical protein [Muribaculum sp.]MCM1552469.1 acyl-protein synthetase [Butyrivibrio sp.]
MRWRGRLFSVKEPFDVKGTQRLFARAMRENCSFQYRSCPEYRRLLKAFSFAPKNLRRVEDLGRLPFIPTANFKQRTMFSVPKRQMLVQATSSGTSGRFSRIGLDFGDLWCGLKMVLQIGKWRGLFSLCPTRYIILGYQPHRSNHTAVTKTAFGATFFAPAVSRVYALKYNVQKQGYEVDLEGIVKALQKYALRSLPVRFMGFPSYTYFLLKQMDERGIHLKLKKGSKIMLGGGWKQFYKEQVDKEVLYRLAKKVLDVDEENVVEFFGAVEHPILYCDCRNHHFHVPVYSRVLIRDVDTLEPLPMGRLGLVNLLSPMVRSTPILSVMTDDLGILHEGGACGCGLDSPYLEIVGRIGLKEIKTCAAGAAELL